VSESPRTVTVGLIGHPAGGGTRRPSRWRTDSDDHHDDGPFAPSRFKSRSRALARGAAGGRRRGCTQAPSHESRSRATGEVSEAHCPGRRAPAAPGDSEFKFQPLSAPGLPRFKSTSESESESPVTRFRVGGPAIMMITQAGIMMV
jgi:hypothetical protein